MRITSTIVFSEHIPANLLDTVLVEINVVYVHSSGRILEAHILHGPQGPNIGGWSPLGPMKSAPMVSNSWLHQQRQQQQYWSFQRRKSRCDEPLRICIGNANANRPSDFVMFHNFKHQIACITMQ